MRNPNTLVSPASFLSTNQTSTQSASLQTSLNSINAEPTRFRGGFYILDDEGMPLVNYDDGRTYRGGINQFFVDENLVIHRHGEGILTDVDGTEYQGNFENDLKNGEFLITHPDLRSATAFYSQDIARQEEQRQDMLSSEVGAGNRKRREPDSREYDDSREAKMAYRGQQVHNSDSEDDVVSVSSLSSDYEAGARTDGRVNSDDEAFDELAKMFGGLGGLDMDINPDPDLSTRPVFFGGATARDDAQNSRESSPVMRPGAPTQMEELYMSSDEMMPNPIGSVAINRVTTEVDMQELAPPRLAVTRPASARSIATGPQVPAQSSQVAEASASSSQVSVQNEAPNPVTTNPLQQSGSSGFGAFSRRK